MRKLLLVGLIAAIPMLVAPSSASAWGWGWGWGHGRHYGYAPRWRFFGPRVYGWRGWGARRWAWGGWRRW